MKSVHSLNNWDSMRTSSVTPISSGLRAGCLAAWAVGFGLALAQETAALGEIVPDANTVVLDHFNGSTTGSAVGTLLFAPSLSRLVQAR